MELIPILSTIILVATISTFILAIGAYILYKIREGKAKQYQEKKAEPLKAELVTSSKLQDQKLYVNEEVVHPKKMTIEEKYIKEVPVEKFDKYSGGQKVNEYPGKTPQNIKEYEVKVPESRFKKFSNNNGTRHSEEEVNQGEILWR